jgi:energy-converting hydrogenase Eha subunit H
MTRIFASLAIFALLGVAANFLIGLTLGDLRSPDVSAETLKWATVHRLGGVAAALAVVFANSLVITYFVGTSRWVREVSETYHLDSRYIVESNRIKRKTFPWATINMLAVVCLVALGGACDPSTGQSNTAAWVLPHFYGAIVVLAFVGGASVFEWNQIAANQQVIASVLGEVARIRKERGVDG